LPNKAVNEPIASVPLSGASFYRKSSLKVYLNWLYRNAIFYFHSAHTGKNGHAPGCGSDLQGRGEARLIVLTSNISV